jgi:hypothetical protein
MVFVMIDGSIMDELGAAAGPLEFSTKGSADRAVGSGCPVLRLRSPSRRHIDAGADSFCCSANRLV